MPAATVDENSVPSIPDLSLAQRIFTAAQSKDAQATAALMADISAAHMAPLYDHLTSAYPALVALHPIDPTELAKMRTANGKEVAEMDTKLEDAEKNFGEMEYYEALVAKANFYATKGTCVIAVEC